MADSIKKQIMGKIEDRFKLILIENGYETDAGKNVFYWRTQPVPENKLPAIVCRDTTNKVEVGAGGLYENVLTVEIDGFVVGSTDSAAKTLLDKLEADIEKAIKVDDTWEGLALTTEKESDETVLERKEKVYGWTSVVVAIEYRTPRWDVYAQG